LRTDVEEVGLPSEDREDGDGREADPDDPACSEEVHPQPAPRSRACFASASASCVIRRSAASKRFAHSAYRRSPSSYKRTASSRSSAGSSSLSAMDSRRSSALSRETSGSAIALDSLHQRAGAAVTHADPHVLPCPERCDGCTDVAVCPLDDRIAASEDREWREGGKTALRGHGALASQR